MVHKTKQGTLELLKELKLLFEDYYFFGVIIQDLKDNQSVLEIRVSPKELAKPIESGEGDPGGILEDNLQEIKETKGDIKPRAQKIKPTKKIKRTSMNYIG